MSAIAKALSLLDHFTDRTPRIGLSELQRLTGRDKATLYRHLSALCDAGLLEQDNATRAYALGPAIEALARRRQRGHVAAVAPEALPARIAAEIGELVHLSRLEGSRLVSVHRSDPGGPGQRVRLDTNFVLPMLGSASGKAVAAFAPDMCAAALPANPALARALLRELDEIARCGVAQSCDTAEVGVSSVAVPLFDAAGAATGACAIAMPTPRATPERMAAARALLMRHAEALSIRQGGIPPPTLTRIWATGARGDRHRITA